MSVPVQLRILALTATPGCKFLCVTIYKRTHTRVLCIYLHLYVLPIAKQKTIQNVIDNLCISMLEYRNENDKDVIPYVHTRKVELIEVTLLTSHPHLTLS